MVVQQGGDWRVILPAQRLHAVTQRVRGDSVVGVQSGEHTSRVWDEVVLHGAQHRAAQLAARLSGTMESMSRMVDSERPAASRPPGASDAIGWLCCDTGQRKLDVELLSRPAHAVRRGEPMAPTSLPTLPPVRRKRRQRKMSRCDRELPQAVEPTGGHASQIMADALWIEQITAEEAAEASGRDAAWIQGIVDGTVDPTLDELELALNAIGLETRVSLGELSSGSLAHKYSKEALRERIRQQRELESEMYGRAWIRRTQPQPGVSTRMAGAGPGRSDGGGRSASLTRRALRDLGVTVNVFSVRAGIDPNQAEQLTRGKWKPATGEFERICASNGLRTTIWLDEYCDDDDDEHAAWEADPAKYEAEIDALRSEFQAFAADPQT